MDSRPRAFKSAKNAAVKGSGDKDFRAVPGHQYFYANLCRCGRPLIAPLAIFIERDRNNAIKPFISAISAQCPDCNRVMALSAFPSMGTAKSFINKYYNKLVAQGAKG